MRVPNDNTVIVVCATLIALAAIFVLNLDSENIVVATVSGLVGYLGGQTKNDNP